MRRRFVTGALAGALAAYSVQSHAAGFFVTDRGVRPMGRAGAYVAGADDQHSMWYNPAGLALAGRGLVIDASLILYGNTFTRRAAGPDGSGNVSYDPVSAQPELLPLPTIIVSHDLGLSKWNFAAGIFAPNAVITNYADSPTAPQRYSLINMAGSALAFTGVWASYRPSEQFSVGFGVQALVGMFNTRVALSACPATLVCQPENPDWDSLAQLNVGPIFAPTANAGIRWQPSNLVVFGLSAQLPVWVNAPASMKVRLPSHPFYDGATVEGDRAVVDFRLAPVLRAGVEVRPTREDRIEFAVVYEIWSVHDRIGVTPIRDPSQPNGIRIDNARGIGTYEVGPVAIERGFQHAISFRLGYERFQTLGNGWSLVPRLGVSYETSATAPGYTSVLTYDTEKFLATAGLGVSHGSFRFDAYYAHMFPSATEVAPEDGRLYQVRPFRTNDQAPRHAINAGRYESHVDVLGVGMRYQF